EALGKERPGRAGTPRVGGGAGAGPSHRRAILRGRAIPSQRRTVTYASCRRSVAQAATGGKAVVVAEAPAVTNAEGGCNQSIKIAQGKKAKSWELRFVMSAARLYQNQGRPEEARSLLAEVYDRFTEGFDTMDLREAKVLLDALS